MLFYCFLFFILFSKSFCELFQSIPPNKLTKQKMMTVNEIVHSELFKYSDCRRILLPVFAKQISTLLEQHEEVSELCSLILLLLLKQCNELNS